MSRETSGKSGERPEPPTVKLIHPNYQPTREELEEPIRTDATMEEMAEALTRTVKVEHVWPRRRR